MPAPKDYDALWRDVRNGLAQMRAFIRNPFANTGLSVPTSGMVVVEQVFAVQEGARSQIDPGGDLDVNGNANIDGTLQVGGPAQFGGAVEVVSAQIASANYDAGVSGWQIAADGSAEFNDLTVRVANDNLTSPILPFPLEDHPVGFALPASLSDVAIADMLVPAPYTRASIVCSAYVNAENNSGVASSIEVSLIAYHTPAGTFVPTDYYVDTLAVSPASSGLDKWFSGAQVIPSIAAGDAVGVRVSLRPGNNWGTDAANEIALQVTVIYT